MAPRVHLLQNDVWQVGVLPETGASTAFGRIHHAGRWLDFMRPTPEDKYGENADCASYVLVPWSNRIKGGVFLFRGKTHTLRTNLGDGTAIHGVAREYSWTTVSSSETSIAMAFDARKAQKPNWPFAFSSRVEMRLEGNAYTTVTQVKNEGTEPFPAGFGHHPYFQRTLTGVKDAVEMEIPCAKSYVAKGCIPEGPATTIDPRVDFRKARPLGTAFIDDCLTGRTGDAPIRFLYPKSGAAIAMELDPLYGHVVYYVPTGHTFFAVEPVTHANDGFNLLERGVGGTGVFVLQPGEEKSAAFTLRVG